MKVFTPIVLLFLGLSLGTSVVQAQHVKPDTLSNWRKKLVFNINVNQAAFSSNWKAGGVNSLGINGMFNYKASYSKNRDNWDNEIDITL